jgi:hypothetical protein
LSLQYPLSENRLGIKAALGISDEWEDKDTKEIKCKTAIISGGVKSSAYRQVYSAAGAGSISTS